jgi:hypothetical protein
MSTHSERSVHLDACYNGFVERRHHDTEPQKIILFTKALTYRGQQQPLLGGCCCRYCSAFPSSPAFLLLTHLGR